jgi:hypothetical protein
MVHVLHLYVLRELDEVRLGQVDEPRPELGVVLWSTHLLSMDEEHLPLRFESLEREVFDAWLFNLRLGGRRYNLRLHCLEVFGENRRQSFEAACERCARLRRRCLLRRCSHVAVPLWCLCNPDWLRTHSLSPAS